LTSSHKYVIAAQQYDAVYLSLRKEQRCQGYVETDHSVAVKTGSLDTYQALAGKDSDSDRHLDWDMIQVVAGKEDIATAFDPQGFLAALVLDWNTTADLVQLSADTR
jgi:hypothetical protein